MNKTVLIIVAAAVIVVGMAFFSNLARPDTPVKSAVTVHKTVTCGCCANYVGYLKPNGYDVEVVDHANNESLSKEKRRLEIPSELDSCHTTVFDREKYFVEGHIPIEAVDKVLADVPNIKGIGMPGMPSASPGMPGEKIEPFNISQVAPEGTISSYLTL